MQTLLLLTIVSGLAASDILLPAFLDAQASTTTHPATATTAKSAAKPASKAATKAVTKAGTKPAKKASTAAHPTGNVTTTSAGRLAPKAAVTGRAAASTPEAAPPVASQAGDTSANGLGGAVAPIGTIAWRDAPDGQTLGSIGPQSMLVPLARDRGWVRVRAEGWVRESDVTTADPSHVTVSAADLRANPEAAVGKTVRWDIEILALATADPLRKGLNPDEPYLLARGPGHESALLYVAVPPALLATAKTVAARAPMSVALVATVRNGRSQPIGVPILDAQSLVRR